LEGGGGEGEKNRLEGVGGEGEKNRLEGVGGEGENCQGGWGQAKSVKVRLQRLNSV